jgi:hypothetical protein
MSCTPRNLSITSLIPQVPLFQGLKLSELTEIASSTRIIVAPRRETLFCKRPIDDVIDLGGTKR